MNKKSTLGEIIKAARKAKGLTQDEVAELVNQHYFELHPEAQKGIISQSALVQIEKRDSSAQKLHAITIWGLAKALDLNGSDLLDIVARDDAPIEELHNSSSGDKAKVSVDNPVQPDRSLSSKIEVLQRLAQEEGIPKWLPNWDSAETPKAADHIRQSYYPAFDLLGSPYEHAKFLIHVLAPAYTNIGMYDLSDQVITSAERVVEQQMGGEFDPVLTAGRFEWRGWNEAHRNPSKRAAAYFDKAYPAVKELGNYDEEATIYHFQSRLAIEALMFHLFPKLGSSAASTSIELMLRQLDTSEALEVKSGDPTGGVYNILWEGRAWMLSRDTQEVRERLNRTLPMFQEQGLKPGEGYTLIESARVLILLETGLSSLTDARRQIENILLLMEGSQHPHMIAEAFTLLAYCHFVTCFTYRLGDKRLLRKGADACELVLRIYPYSTHPLYAIAKQMKKHFISAMSQADRQSYHDTLEGRVSEEDGYFRWLTSLPHTSEDYNVHRLMVSRLISKL